MTGKPLFAAPPILAVLLSPSLSSFAQGPSAQGILGTASLFTDINTTAQVDYASASGLVVYGGSLYVIGANETYASGWSAGLWKYDPATLDDFVILRDIRPGGRGSNVTWKESVSSRLCFSADDGSHGAELLCTSGALWDTNLVADVAPSLMASSPPI